MKAPRIAAAAVSIAMMCTLFTGCERTCVFNLLSDYDVELSEYDKVSYFWINSAEDEFDSNNLEFISENPEIATFEFDEVVGTAVYYRIAPISDGETDVYVKCKACGAESKKIHVTVDGAPAHTEETTATTVTTEETTTTTTTTTATSVETTEAATSAEDESGYSLKFGDLLSAIENNIDGKNVIVVKAKITSRLTNKMTIDQNYHNVEDLIKNQGCDKFDEIQYWAVADMADGSEGKVISFTVDSDLIQEIKSSAVVAIQMGDYVSDLYILPSLLN